MIKYYFKTAWRNLIKNKKYTLINIIGLAIGLSCFLLISLYVMNELSYDRYFPKANRIYRINTDIRFGGTDLHMPLTSDMMGQLLKKDYPQVENYTRIYTSNGDKLIRKGNEYLDEIHVANVDSTFFKVFQLPVVEGDIYHALSSPNTVVLTESAARKYFGREDVIGQTLKVKDDKAPYYKITAVIKDIPPNTHFHFDFFFSMAYVDYKWGQLTSHNFYTYLLLRKGTDSRDFEKNFSTYIKKYVVPYARQWLQFKSWTEFEKAGNRIAYSLIPLTKIHLYSNRTPELSPGGNIQYVYIFSVVALFILLIGCINFMNLTTARSAGRAKEVGVRKVLGISKKYLIFQFLSESTFLVICSLLLALSIVFLVLPLFNNIAYKQLSFSNLFELHFLLLLLLLPVIVGLLAGLYPAFFLSSFKPVKVLKGAEMKGNRKSGLRSFLVVFQFFISIILIIGTIIVYDQLDFIREKNLGYNKNQVLVVNGIGALNNNIQSFKNQVKQLPAVTSATLSGYLPVTSSDRSDNIFSKEAVMNSENGFDMQDWWVDYGYIPTLGMQLIQGRNFSRQYGTDSSAIIINQKAADALGYTDPIGKKVYNTGENGKMNPYTIIGEVKNFNFESLHHQVGPLCFMLGGGSGLGIFKIHTDQIERTVKKVKSIWDGFNSDIPFSYRFLDDSYNKMYRADERVGKIASIFALLAILIACLGLFGLVTYAAEQRTKEISIRKVLGASVSNIIQLLAKDFIILVLLAIVIAIPVSWWTMNKWLEDFAYKINISVWVFLIAGFIAIAIALLTISFQSVKAAMSNPVESLRTE